MQSNMKTIHKIAAWAFAGLLFCSCSDDNKFPNENINPDVYKELAIVFPGDSKEYTADYEVNTTLRLKARIIGRRGLERVEVGSLFGEEPVEMLPVAIPEDGRTAFDLNYEVMADESFSVRGFKGFVVRATDAAGETVSETYSITGNIVKDPKLIKFKEILMTLNLTGHYPDMSVDGNSYFGSMAPKAVMNYEEAKANQDKIDFMLVGQLDNSDHAGQVYPFGLFTPNRQNDMPLTSGLYQKDFTQFPDVYMSYAFNVSAADFDAIYNNQVALDDVMLKYLSAYSASVNDKGWVWIPAGGVLFFRIGGGVITQFNQAFDPDIRWGFVKFNANWGSTLCEQTASISVVVQRPEASGLAMPQ